ncbi:MAG: phosphoribosylformylglycinamidine cyclo-ligase [Planctomycetota bacterium]
MPSAKTRKPLTYKSSGIDLQRYDGFIATLETVLRRTHGPRVISNPGGFGGLFRLDYNEDLFQRNYADPVLVACADGVGTKIRIAQALQRYDTIGIDLVAMNVNDLVVEGAEPLFFLDIISVNHVDQAVMDPLVRGIARGCEIAGCALLGGETAEMGDLYQPGDFDVNGFALGVVELKKAVSRRKTKPGDIVLGLESDGVHSNGYTLVRNIVKTARLDLQRTYPQLATEDDPSPTLGEVLIKPTRIYADSVVRLLRAYRVKKVVTAMAHVTGGGLADNLARTLTDDVDAKLDRSAWPVPPIFDLLQQKGNVTGDEMAKVFNMGIGYVIVVRPAFADAVADRLRRSGERVHKIGRLVKGAGRVKIS